VSCGQHKGSPRPYSRISRPGTHKQIVKVKIPSPPKGLTEAVCPRSPLCCYLKDVVDEPGEAVGRRRYWRRTSDVHFAGGGR
jgi:hypothetical protein